MENRKIIEWDVSQAAAYLGIKRQLVVYYVREDKLFNSRYVGEVASKILMDRGIEYSGRRQIVIEETIARMNDLKEKFKNRREYRTKKVTVNDYRLNPFEDAKRKSDSRI